jgi:hypothetical protein
MRVAKVATGFLFPIILENLLEYSLIMIMANTKEMMYAGKASCSKDFENASIPSKKQASNPTSRLSQDTSTVAIFGDENR